MAKIPHPEPTRRADAGQAMAGDFDLEQTLSELEGGVSSEESYRQLFLHLWPMLHRFFGRCGVAPELRNDLTQETLLGIYTGIGGFRHQARFKTWIFTIATNVHKKHLRRHSALKRDAEELSIDDTGPEARSIELSTDRPDPEHRALDRERTRRLLAAVDTLPERMRQCLIFRTFHDMSYDQIAVVLKLSRETVRSHLFHARQRLREGLAEAGIPTRDSPENRHG